MKKTLLSSLVALGLTVLPLAAQAGTVTVKGSDTMVILAQRWAEAFMKKNPSVKVQVTGGGSGTGLAALQNGTTDIAMSSREMKKAEEDKLKAGANAAPTGLSVAKDGVTFYVNASNPLDALTVEQLRDIYLGDTTSWKAVGGAEAPIVLYSRENSSGTYVFVKDAVLDGEDFASAAQTLPGTAAVVNAVSKEKHGIGYGGAAFAKGIKELKVKKGNEAFAPSAQNVKSGKYPLSRDLYFYLRNKPAGDVKAFIDFALSPEGQAIVTQVGYFPVK
ncbi:phosphate ABC transporter substrate-binding protein [Corallococcus sp. ZKHCc1 1396]|uniref:Phosphate-binding protein n=1 Tax=Corallococcus soli TaxID=2710757 RepID=A0ABR9PZQ4_9BACT|nr:MULTISPECIES: phosphate ABC transporter substrate-binding protein [Corallococcus]MBE4753402.1 phosphate ABC transporter substrate-binding protein [Corallococcus soli]MCY1031483.1 phosphate ABC transporter substrate-binding protein [Corallococcus sp. BB11-1]RYZ46297.1 MAG: phosphate ABC transporter substrate-binding protein [Myxococcaceae bacterium]